MLPLDAGSETGEAQTPTSPLASERLDDLVLANAIAHAIRDVPGVLDMGQGLFARVATYGPGKHINGVVLRHPSSGELSVEVNVVLDETTIIKAYSDVSSSSDNTPVLLRCTDHIRSVVSHTIAHLGLQVPITVDVTIDDIR
jgi:hypothetical protein